MKSTRRNLIAIFLAIGLFSSANAAAPPSARLGYEPFFGLWARHALYRTVVWGSRAGCAAATTAPRHCY
jgi:hypothetical protein